LGFGFFKNKFYPRFTPKDFSQGTQGFLKEVKDFLLLVAIIFFASVIR